MRYIALWLRVLTRFTVFNQQNFTSSLKMQTRDVSFVLSYLRNPNAAKRVVVSGLRIQIRERL